MDGVQAGGVGEERESKRGDEEARVLQAVLHPDPRTAQKLREEDEEDEEDVMVWVRRAGKAEHAEVKAAAYAKAQQLLAAAPQEKIALWEGCLRLEGNKELGLEQDVPRALDLLEQAGKGGSAEAWAQLGEAYAAGAHGAVEVDAACARQCYEKATALQEHATALFGLGKLWDEARLEEGRDEALAIEYYTRAVEQGSESALVNLATVHTEREEYEQAYHLFSRGAQTDTVGDVVFSLGLMYHTGHFVDQDPEVAFRLYQRSLEIGFKGVYFNLGTMHLFGDGTEQDYVRARECFEKAIEHEDNTGSALLNLAKMHREGLTDLEGQERFDACVVLYERAMNEYANANAAFQLGRLYEDGVQGVVDKCWRKAKEYFEVGANLDEPSCTTSLGLLCTLDEDPANPATLGIGPADLPRAFELFKKGAALGCGAACFSLGRLYMDGEPAIGVAKDTEKGLRLLETAGTRGHLPAFALLGSCFSRDSECERYGLTKNLALAKEFYHRGAQQRQQRCMERLGFLLLAEGNLDAARPWLAAACNTVGQTDPVTQCNYGILLYKLAIRAANDAAASSSSATAAAASLSSPSASGQARPPVPPLHDEEAVQMFRASAEQGYPPAYFHLGYCLKERGEFEPALHWLERGAELEEPQSLFSLANMYEKGVHVERDARRAQELYERAAAHDSVDSEYALGYLLSRQDRHREAVQWWGRAAEHGDTESMFCLGVQLANGRGVAKDQREAMYWYERAAEHDMPSAIHNLAVIFHNGTGGVDRDFSRAYTLYERAAGLGHRLAMFYLGVLNEQGLGVPRDTDAAHAHYLRAAEADIGQAHLALGRMYHFGTGRAVDFAAAVRHYRRALELERLPEAMTNLGVILRYGHGNVAQDTQEALALYHEAAELGHPRALYSMGYLYQTGSQGLVEQNYDTARRYYEMATEGDDVDAIFNLGTMHQGGEGVPVDLARAAQYYERAAAMGLPDARLNLAALLQNGGEGVAVDHVRARHLHMQIVEEQQGGNSILGSAHYNLGLAYHYGDGDVNVDYERAHYHYEQGVALGDAQSMTNLGFLYRNGLGVAQDYTRARELYGQSAAAGDPQGMYNLAIMYQNGYGVDQDYTHALQLFTQAAQLGEVRAHYCIGLFHRNGQGVPQSYALAAHHFGTGAELGLPAAQVELGELHQLGLVEHADVQVARTLFEQGVTHGLPKAMALLGRLYMNGQGVEQDHARALELYQMAADVQDPHGLCGLGVLHARGLGMPADRTAARAFFVAAVTHGDIAEAHFQLALLLRAPGTDEVPQDFVQSRMHLEQAAAQHHRGAIALMAGNPDN